METNNEYDGDNIIIFILSKTNVFFCWFDKELQRKPKEKLKSCYNDSNKFINFNILFMI